MFIFKLEDLPPANVLSLKLYNKRILVKYILNAECSEQLISFLFKKKSLISASILNLNNVGDILQEWKFKDIKNFDKQLAELNYNSSEVFTLDLSFDFKDIIYI